MDLLACVYFSQFHSSRSREFYFSSLFFFSLAAKILRIIFVSSSSSPLIAMDSITFSSSIPSTFSIFCPKRSSLISKRPLIVPISSKNKENGSDLSADSDKNTNLVSFPPLSNDSAMGLVLSAAVGRGWTTGSGMEGPPEPESDISNRQVSTFPWSLFTKSPRRRMRVAFTCNICSQRTTRAINPHAYTDGTVFVQCCGCNVFHKLVDHLNLFHEMNCYVNPNFRYRGGDVRFNFLDRDNEDDGRNIFPIL